MAGFFHLVHRSWCKTLNGQYCHSLLVNTHFACDTITCKLCVLDPFDIIIIIIIKNNFYPVSVPDRQRSAAAVMWAAALAAVIGIALAWLYRINSAMESVPEEAAKFSPRRWTKQQVRDTYEQLKQKPFDFVKKLPPRLDRRYVVVGGSGEPIPPQPGVSD